MAHRFARAVSGSALAAVLAASWVATPGWAAVPAPRLAARSLQDLPTPLPYPYDEKASAAEVNARLDAAFAQARRSGKRVIVDMGGNWCSWCRMLAAVMDLPQAKPFIAANFVVVTVPVTSAQASRDDENRQVLKRFKIRKIDGYPYLVVAEPDGRVLARSSAVTDDAHHTPQAMLDWIAQWAKPAPGNVTKAAAKGRGIQS